MQHPTASTAAIIMTHFWSPAVTILKAQPHRPTQSGHISVNRCNSQEETASSVQQQANYRCWMR